MRRRTRTSALSAGIKQLEESLGVMIVGRRRRFVGFTPEGERVLAWALAVGCSIAAMMATRTVHPPAGSNPVIVFLGHAGWGFLLFPVVSGALVLVLIGWLYNNALRKTPYPHHW